jgi:hypothetical protein
MHAVIEDILHRFEKFPEAQVSHDSVSILFHPPTDDGYEVQLVVHREDCFQVRYAGCSQYFGKAGRAIACFGLGLSQVCRVREYSFLGRPCYWEIQEWDRPKRKWAGIWSEWRGIGWILSHLWWTSARIRHNSLVDADENEGAGGA